MTKQEAMFEINNIIEEAIKNLRAVQDKAKKKNNNDL